MVQITGLSLIPPSLPSIIVRPDSNPLDFCDSDVALLLWYLYDWAVKWDRWPPSFFVWLWEVLFVMKANYQLADWNSGQQHISSTGTILAIYFRVDNVSLICSAKRVHANCMLSNSKNCKMKVAEQLKFDTGCVQREERVGGGKRRAQQKHDCRSSVEGLWWW